MADKKDNVFQIDPYKATPNALRSIANDIDAGKYPPDQPCTIILGEAVFHVGCSIVDESAALRAIWDMNYGIHLLLKAATEP